MWKHWMFRTTKGARNAPQLVRRWAEDAATPDPKLVGGEGYGLVKNWARSLRLRSASKQQVKVVYRFVDDQVAIHKKLEEFSTVDPEGAARARENVRHLNGRASPLEIDAAVDDDADP